MRFGVMALVLAGAVTAAAADGWEPVLSKDGVTLEQRACAEPSMHELRVTAHSPVAPAGVMATLWKQDEYPQFIASLKRVQILHDDGDRKLIYEQIAVPMVQDRDLVVRVTRQLETATGVYEITNVAAPDEGPPPSAAFVRVRNSTAHWRLVPAADHGTDVTYEVKTDGGGSLPAFVIAAVQRRTALPLVKAMLDRARANAAGAPPAP